MAGDDTEKLLLTSEAYHDQTGQVTEANLQFDGLREWKRKVLEYHRTRENTQVVEYDDLPSPAAVD